LPSERPYSIEDLVKYASFEEVAMLLRDGELPSSDALADFQKVLHERYEVKRDIRLMMWALPANGHSVQNQTSVKQFNNIIIWLFTKRHG
jgi:citrate synthase